MNGYIKLHKVFLEWEWAQDCKMVQIFIRCLLKANYKDQTWKGQIIPRGSFVSSISNLSQETGLSFQQVRTCLDKLKATGEITTKSTNKNTLITIVKYGDYQDFYLDDNKQTNNQHNNQITTTKEYNNIYNSISSMSEVETSDEDALKKFPSNPIASAGSTKQPKVKKDYLQTKKISEVMDSEVPEDQLQYFKTAQAFRKLFIKNQKERSATTTKLDKATYKNFVDPIRLMFEKDGVTKEQLRRVYEFLRSKEGDFWKKNILSTQKLRIQIDQLSAKSSIKVPNSVPLEERKEAFKKEVISHQSNKFTKDILEDFFIYWSEYNKGENIMKWEKQSTFQIENRLHTFYRTAQEKIKKTVKL